VQESELKIRDHVAEVIELRRAEFDAAGKPMSFEQIALAMGEYGKEAVLRIMKRERPITVDLVDRLAKALKLRDPLVNGRADASVGSRWVPGGGTRNWSFLRTFISRGGSIYALARLITVLGQDVINDPHAVDAIRALGAIDDKAKRKQLADTLLAVARDHERMTGNRRLLVGPPSRPALIHPEIRPRPKATTPSKGGSKKR